MKLLLVEDNEMSVAMLTRRLKKRQFDVLVAMTGADAIELTRTAQPAIVLMDVELPDIDGWEATRILKADPATAGIPIIAVTAHAMADHRDKSFAAGCDEFETKPIDFEQLLEKITRLTARGS